MSTARLKALLHITSAKLDEEENDEFISSQLKFLLQCIKRKETDKDTNCDERIQLTLKCLINLCSSAARNQLFFSIFHSEQDRSEFIDHLEKLWIAHLDRDADMGDLARNLLCNLTRDTAWSSIATQKDPKRLLESMFLTDQTLIHSLPLLLNLTSQKEIRQHLSVVASLRTRLVNLLLPQPADLNLSLLVTGILKNCFFDDDYHLIWLAPQSRMLEAILRPLCGPDDSIDDEDRSKLPVGLQTVVGCENAVRTESDDLKQTVCEALLQLCATSEGRTRLRDCGTYFILRELHKFENSKLTENSDRSAAATKERSRTNELLYHIEQVVDQLICEEEERDRYSVEHSLRSINIDSETSAKLEQAKQEFITAS